MILSAIRLLDVPAQAEKWERVVLWCVVALGALSHTGHVLMLISLVLLTPAIFRFSGLPFHWRMLRPLVAAIFVAGAGAAFFTAMVVETYGKPPLRPPFLSARVIADGPGYAHLVETCGEPRYALCAYVDRLPRSAAAILWNKDPETGIWGAAGPDTRRAISEQDLRFASDVLRTYPLDQVQASAHRFVEQLRWFGLEDFPYSLGLRQIIDTWWSGREAGAIQSTRFYTGHFPIDAINMLYKLVVIASALHLVTLAIARNRSNAGGELQSSFGLFAVFVTVCIVLNAAIYGILSDPAPRYQGRVIWLFPMMSAIILWRDLLWENVMLGYRRRPPAE